MANEFEITEEGIVEFRTAVATVPLRAIPEVRRVLGAYAQKIRSDAINSMRRSTPMGRTYAIRIKGRKKGFLHRASAPGQAPAVVTGRLWNSITTDIAANGMRAEIGPTVNYGKYLETGTDNGLAARPFMGPALDANIAGLENALANAIRKAVRGLT